MDSTQQFKDSGPSIGQKGVVRSILVECREILIFLMTEMYNPSQLGSLKSTDVDEGIRNGEGAHDDPESRTYDLAEGELSQNVGDTVALDVFELGPNIEVPEELFEPLCHPGSVKDLCILTVRESLHEFLPRRPGHHGILYLNREDVPKYLV